MRSFSALISTAATRRDAMAAIGAGLVATGAAAAAAPAADPDAAIHALRRDLQEASAAWETLYDITAAALDRAVEAVPSPLPKLEYQRRLNAAKVAQGYMQARAAEEAAHARIWPMLQRLLAIEPATLAGYAAKNAALLAAFVDTEDDSDEPRDVMLRQMLAEAERVAGVRS